MMTTANNYTFHYSEEETTEKTKLNIGPLIFGAVALVSNFYFSTPLDSTTLSTEVAANATYSINLTKENSENTESINNKNINAEGVFTLKLTNSAIINSGTVEEMEVLDVEELRKLQESFDRSSEKSHKLQLKVTEQLATLNTEAGHMKSELKRLNKNQDELPTLIRDEFKKIQYEKSDSNKINWFAPLITGVVTGGILLAGQYLLGMI